MIPEHFNVLGLQVRTIDYSGMLDKINSAVTSRRKLFVCFANVYSVMVLRKDATLLGDINATSFVVSDGMPIVWLGKFYGKRSSRVYGTALTRKLCEVAAQKKHRLFFIGGNTGQSARLKKFLLHRYPGIVVVGTEEVTFRPMGQAQEKRVVRRINQSRADIVFVCLGCPHQEKWIVRNRARISAPVAMGVGSTIDFLSGDKTEAPEWMQVNGLEWVYRFIQEPRRLWHRYTVISMQFVWHIGVQIIQDALAQKEKSAA